MPKWLACVAHTHARTRARKLNEILSNKTFYVTCNSAMQSTSTACSPLLSYSPLHCTLSLFHAAYCAAHVTFALQQQQQINFNSHLNILQSQRFLTRRSRRQQQRRQLTNKNKQNTKQQQQQQQQASIRNATAECVGPRDNVLFMYKANLFLLLEQ